MKPLESDNKVAQRARGSSCLKIIVGMIVLLTIVFHLSLAAKGRSDYRGQHLGTALEYAKGKIDLLRPVIVGFNAGGTPIAQEIPVWQATAAIFFKCFGPWFGWANLTSCLFMIAGLWPIFQLAKTALGERGAWWSLVFFTAQPLIFWLGGRGGTDGSCLTFMVWFLFFAEKLLQTAQFRWFLPAVFFGTMSATTKAPFFFCAGLTSFFVLLFQFRNSLRRWILLSLVGMLATVIFLCWTHWTDSLFAQAEFPFVDLRLSGSTGQVSTFYWFFGDLSYRLNPAVWGRAGWLFLNAEFGSFVLVGLSAAGFLFLRSGLFRYWFAATALTILVFTHVILHHDNYYLMVSPAVAVSGAAAFCRLESALGERYPKVTPWLAPAMTALLLLATVQGMIGMKFVLDTDPYPRQMAKLIQEHSTAADKLLIQGGDWGGNELFLAHRTGLTIWNTELIENPQNLNRLRELGYTKLVMLNGSPLLAAVERVTPGKSNTPRRSFRDALTPAAEHWPTLFENDDMLIKEIPPR